MPLDKYDFSDRYPFFQDKFGVAWQVMLSDKTHITPAFLFVGNNFKKADAAVKLYTKIFKKSKINDIVYYEDKKTIMHSSFQIEGQEFMAMDGPGEHKFTFNESISFIVNCKTQKEVDYYWNALSKGGAKVQCGWLKDRFGVSWQIVPTILDELLASQDKKKAGRVMAVMLQMQKLDIAKLKAAVKA